MKNLNHYLRHSLKLSRSENIIERLKLTKDSKLQKQQYKYYPKDFDELRSLLKQLLKERGKNAYLNDIDVSKVDKFDKGTTLGLFEGLNPRNIDISEWDVSNVESMIGIFYKCYNFNCDLSNWNVSNVKDMSNMFKGCVSFNGDGLENWNVSNVENMSFMFDGCIKFNCDLSKWDVSKVKYMNAIFSECESLKNKPSWYKE